MTGQPEQAQEITVWWCDECGYWRKEETTGVHVIANPLDPNGRLVSHELRPVVFVLDTEPEGRTAPEAPPSSSSRPARGQA